MNRPHAAASSSLRNSTGTARHGTADQPRGRRSTLIVTFRSDAPQGPDPVGEGYLEKVGRLNAARMQAEEIVLSELILPAPEE